MKLDPEITEADRAFLQSLIDGSIDPFNPSLFVQLEPMFTRYPEGTEMHVLLERSADVYCDAALAAANGFIAIEKAREVITRAMRRRELD